MPSGFQDLLDPKQLEQVKDYDLLARRAVEGFISGLHRSVLQGPGTEFAHYRSYIPGDDPRYLDQKVLARTDKLLMKTYHDETNTHCNIILDTSASHSYKGSRAPCSKLHYARMLAAVIAYLASRQSDHVGLFAYNEKLHTALKANHQSGQLKRILQSLSRLEAEGTADHQRWLTTLPQNFRRRGIVVFISDMLEAETTLPKLLRTFNAEQCQCLAIQILDPDELDLNLPEPLRFAELEGSRELNCWPKNIRKSYTEKMNHFLHELRDGLKKANIELLQLNTRESIGAALASYLHNRERLG